jgi:chemotaxis protein CheX
MNDPLSLPARFDSASVQAFTESLKTLRAQPLALDGSRVTTVGALAVQALIAARLEWQQDEVDFRLAGPSEALLEACRVLGVAPAEIGAQPDGVSLA